MKTNRVAFGFLVVLILLDWQGNAEGSTRASVDTPAALTSTNASTDSTNQNTSVPEDDAPTFDEAKAQAEKGDATAQLAVGSMYFYGQGVKTNFVEAAEWFRKAAEQGNAQAEYALADCYALGNGVPRDYVEAARWCHKAADGGYVIAQFILGVDYRAGFGVSQDYAEAAKWLKKAADKGFPDAENELGKLYAGGLGVRQDYAKAVGLFQTAAEQGNANAQYGLGLSYEIGQGVPEDYVQAYKWLNLAAAQGDTNALSSRDSIANSMTQDQIAEGQKLASEFVSQKETPGSSPNSIALPDNPTASGTGFFITEDGFLVTCAHVVAGATKVQLVTSDGTIDAKVIQTDTANDVALLKAEGKFSALPVAASRAVSLGDTVATVGFPDPGLQGFLPKLVKGEISALAGTQDNPRYFQISLPVQPGNSGGALVDEQGNVVGIVAAKLDAATALAASGALPENVNYAIKSSFLLSFLESVPDVDAKLKAKNTADEKFPVVVKSAQDATVLVLVY